MIELLVEAKRDADAARAGGDECIDPRMLGRYRRRYSTIIDSGHRANPPVMPVTAGRRPARSKAANLLARLDSQHDDVLRFATDLTVPFDHNLSERHIRMVELQQKVSGCWRSPGGRSDSASSAATSPRFASREATCWRRCGGCSRVTPGCLLPPAPDPHTAAP
jgi:transposase